MLRAALLAGLATGLAGFAGADEPKDDKKDAAAKEWKLAEGRTFRLTTIIADGKEKPVPEDSDTKLTFMKGKVIIAHETVTLEADLTLDPTKAPKEFTAKFPKDVLPVPVHGIYDHMKDTFRLGVGTAESPVGRPKSFEKAKLVLVFAEVKPKK